MKSLDDFYLEEYRVLSNAHFETSKKATTFFQYALLVLTVPITILGITNVSMKVLTIAFFIVAVLGFFILLYLCQLRIESLLYARSINKIRNVMYSNAMKYDKKSSIAQAERSILFSQSKKPQFFDTVQFIYIVIAISLLNGFYMGFAIHLFYPCLKMIFVVLIGAIFTFSQIVVYKVMSLKSESGLDYFDQIIGVDIDGVLNAHEEHFASVYNKLIDESKIISRKVDVSEITTISVHKSGVITEEDEHKVFYEKDYWEKMPARGSAHKYLTKLKNQFAFKIHIFTWRDWKVSDLDMRKTTKNWLQSNKISFDKLNLEKGNYNLPIKKFTSQYRNRFYFSLKRKIKFFVEDELIKARKLASICSYVFLINHKYNELLNEDESLPYNVIRVENWEEIYDCIKELS